MKYMIVREDQVKEEILDANVKKGMFFTREELIEMSSLSQIEVVKGNTKLNGKMAHCTRGLAQMELAAQLNHLQVEGRL